MSFIEDLTKYEFLQNALLAGVLIGLVAPLIGVYLVVRRLSLIADALSHVGLSGVAAGLLLQKEVSALASLSPIYTGMGFSVVGALFVERIRKLYQSYQELAIPILLSTGTGLGVVLISVADGFNVDIAGYLFGNILAVRTEEIQLIAVVAVLVFLFLIFFYKEMFALSFDEEHAVLSGVPRRWINFLFLVLVALVVSAAIRVVGVLLVSALITLPAAASLQIGNSFRQVLGWSVLYAQISVLAGLLAAYYFDFASGGAIVLVSVMILLINVFVKQVRRRVRSTS
ncbi:metal ABC transporter permease [Risungbinella massiliensis]|uniref:metal ABC transporter permease n=1 Tax=Risungbinella massiliensis TaxID=1329796 RepID=UPI0005CC75C5|nr:metal ABC transporter permease [Risungbinella massiliensis]